VIIESQTYNLEVPKPKFNLEMTTEILHPLMASPGPSGIQKDDSALVAPEHCHRAYAAPDNLEVSPVPPENHEADAAPDNLADPSENQEADAATNSSPNPPVARPRQARAASYPTWLHPLMASPGPSESQKADSALGQPENYHCANAAPDNPKVSPVPPENHEADTATNPSLIPPAINPLVLSTPENQELDAAAKPAPDLAIETLTPPRLDIRSTRAKLKRRHSRETGDKARLVPQDDLMTRITIQEKDRTIETLEDEVSD